MKALLPTVDPQGLAEFSVVFTDRSLNHMSEKFQQVMRDIHGDLTQVYGAGSVAIIPGGGTFAMEAIARQFATDKNCLVIRNGWFSFRWTQIFETGGIPSACKVMKAERSLDNIEAPFAPADIDRVVAAIKEQKPEVIFAPHVETASGIILPNDYIEQIGTAAREVGALFVLDCIASGCVFVNMKALNVDVLISAPQKGWSSSPSAGLVMLGERALERLDKTNSTSFSCDLKKWHDIMQAYIGGGHAYHATMPTDALSAFRDVINEMKAEGFAHWQEQQWELGRQACSLIEGYGFKSVAEKGFKAPGVIVSYTSDAEIQNGKKFSAIGAQIAAGVPLQLDEGADFRTFRIGLFGLDKLRDVDATILRLKNAFSKLI